MHIDNFSRAQLQWLYACNEARGPAMQSTRKATAAKQAHLLANAARQVLRDKRPFLGAVLAHQLNNELILLQF